MSNSIIYDSDGKEVKSIRYLPCPDCGRGPDQRIPSGGFGNIVYLICPCGREFKELTCEKVIL